MLSLYNRIDRLRVQSAKPGEKPLSINAVCKAAGVAQGSVADLKGGRSKNLSAQNAIKLAGYFHVTVDYLLGNDPQADADDFAYEVAELEKEIAQAESDGERAYLKMELDTMKARHEDPALDAYLDGEGPYPYGDKKPSTTPLNVERVAAMAPVLGKIPAGYPVYAVEEVLGYQPVPEDIPRPEECFFLEVSGDSMIGAGIYPGDRVLIRHQDCAENGQIVAFRVNGDDATLKRLHYQGEQVVLVPANDKYAPIIIPAAQFESGEAAILGVALTVTHKL